MPSYISESFSDDACSLSLVAAEQQPIGVDQPPGTGHNYPFVSPQNNEEQVIGDLFLRFADPDCSFVLPFQIAWLFGFGCDPAFIDETIVDVGTEHMLILDSQNRVVFDTRNASYTRKSWGPRAWIVEWRHVTDATNADEDVLRVVYYMQNANGDPVAFPKFIRLSNGTLDGRTTSRVAAKLTRLSILGQSGAIGDGNGGLNKGILASGYNTELTVSAAAVADGGRRVTTFNIDMSPGLGLGKYTVDCDDITGWGIKKINNIRPSNYQNFDITAEENSCTRIQRPWKEQLSDPVFGCRTAKLRTAALEIDGDCPPCCSCDNFIAVYESIRRLSAILTDHVARAHAVRDWLKDGIARIDQQRECRAQHRLRAYAQPECPDKIACSIAYCNSTVECVKNVLIPISFEYNDAINSDINAYTNYNGNVDGLPGIPLEICGFTKRAGNVSEKYIYQLARPYVLGGKYPNYWVFFDAIERGSIGFVTFFVEFPSSQRGDTAKFAIDAYSLPTPPLVSSTDEDLPVLPANDYVVGSGPTSTSAACIAWRLVAEPVLAGASILQSPCCVDDLGEL